MNKEGYPFIFIKYIGSVYTSKYRTIFAIQKALQAFIVEITASSKQNQNRLMPIFG
jgi:hypothetical protein